MALDDEELPEFDVHASVMDLPYILGTTVETIPADVPYLFADAEFAEHWKRELGAIEGFRIGILWQGNPKFLADAYRSVRLQEFLPLAALEGVQLLSLQKGQGIEQLHALGQWADIVDLGSAIDDGKGDFMDMAAIMMNLDLIISVDSAIGHLAGALGGQPGSPYRTRPTGGGSSIALTHLGTPRSGSSASPGCTIGNRCSKSMAAQLRTVTASGGTLAHA